MNHARLEKLTATLGTLELDAVILNPGPTLTYLTGLHFHLMERPVVLVVAPGKEPVLVLPELELPKLDRLTYKMQAVVFGETPSEWGNAFRKSAQMLMLDGKRIGIEPRQLRLMEYGYVKDAAPKAEFLDASPVLSILRLKKDQTEIDSMRRAVHIAQNALEAAIPLIQIGMTERALASELVIQLLKNGADPKLPFSPIVSAGPNAANPHAAPTERKLQAGDMLVVDWGAAHEGYVSDLTRTFAVGEVSAEFQKIHTIVQEANAAGRAAGRPGIPCSEVDKAARGVIEQTGYGRYFTHRTGHGIGMEGHEEPYIRGDNLLLLEPGMAYTVEPGIYLPGRNGVRIEDNLVVTASGTECLSTMPREIRVVG
jgi:Xaa-Pro dipeptidase